MAQQPNFANILSKVILNELQQLRLGETLEDVNNKYRGHGSIPYKMNECQLIRVSRPNPKTSCHYPRLLTLKTL
jgi:hypothetical protein